MKTFLKLLVSIIIIIVSVFTVYFLLISMNAYDIKNASGDKLNNQENPTQELQSGESVLESNSGDYAVLNGSGENIINKNEPQYSGDEKSRIIDKSNVIENQNNSANVKNTIEDSLGLDILGIENKDLFETFKINEMSVTVQIAGSMVYILPVSDFVNNVQYHYDDDGNLVLYISELIGVGGEIRYYFDNNNLVTIEKKIEEQININYEDENDILSRSKLIYDKYMIEN